MDKRFISIVFLIIFAFLITSCSEGAIPPIDAGNEDFSQGDQISNTVTDGDARPPFVDDSAVQENENIQSDDKVSQEDESLQDDENTQGNQDSQDDEDTQDGGEVDENAQGYAKEEDGWFYYPDILYNIIILADISDYESVEKYMEEEYKYLHVQGNSQLPTIYEFIQRFQIKREDFERVNDYNIKINKEHNINSGVYTDKQIELMFGGYDDETIMRELKADTAFYYDGRLYNTEDISKLDKLQLKEMDQNGELTEYLNNMKIFYGERYWLVERVDNTLKKMNSK